MKQEAKSFASERKVDTALDIADTNREKMKKRLIKVITMVKGTLIIMNHKII